MCPEIKGSKFYLFFLFHLVFPLLDFPTMGTENSISTWHHSCSQNISYFLSVSTATTLKVRKMEIQYACAMLLRKEKFLDIVRKNWRQDNPCLPVFHKVIYFLNSETFKHIIWHDKGDFVNEMKLQTLKLNLGHQAQSHRPFKMCETVDELKKCADRCWQDGSVFTNVLFLQMTQVPFPVPRSGSLQPPITQSLGFQSPFLVPRTLFVHARLRRHKDTHPHTLNMHS